MLRCYSVPLKGSEENGEVMDGPPTGTVTFLITDIEGSTKMWESHPQVMHGALSRHDVILRKATQEHGGYVFKTVGDAFCCAFPTAPDALEAALEAQRTLLSEQWVEGGPIRMKMALHTGAAEERDGDYFGQPLNRVARLLSAAHGGQVLLSLPTQELVRDLLPSEVGLRDLGEKHLKDLFRPERVFQLLVSDLPSEFPPLKTLDQHGNNLPVQPTPLVGREREVAEVCERLLSPEVRLLTLTGPGGTGKTRVGLQAAAELLEEFEEGAFFVTLATLTDPTLVAPSVTQALGVAESGEKPPEDALREFLRERELLLLMDNFEQVLDATPLLEELLAAAPRLKVLTTSRAALRLYGEHEFPVPPLALPDPAYPPPPERLTQYEAVRLFVERARAVKPDFSVTNENAPAVAEICVRLDGLPLAIELAAARTRLLPPRAMLAKLSSRLKLLTGGARNLPERQRTLRGAIEWSYELLSPEERTLFARLSVFAGGRTLEAIETICNPETELDTLDGLESLLEKSLLRQEEGPEGEPRFVMLETIHEFAREKLEESREAEELRRLHAEYFLAMAEESEPHMTGPEQVVWLDRLEAEHDNLRAVLSWSLESGDIELGLKLASATNHYWIYRGHLSEAARWLEQALERSEDVPEAVRAKALSSAGGLAIFLGSHERTDTFLQEAAALYRKLGDDRGVANVLKSLGNSSADRSHWQRAEALYREALELGRDLKYEDLITDSLINLGWAALCQENYDQATVFCREALGLAQDNRDKGSVAAASLNLGWAELGKGDHAQAGALFRESLSHLRELNDPVNIAECLEGFAGVAGAQGQGKRTARLYGIAESLRESLGTPLLPGDRPRYERHLSLARSLLDEVSWKQAWKEGRAMKFEEAISYALEEGDSA
jgi:predicted ATPase/class 3 adenylate cyclase